MGSLVFEYPFMLFGKCSCSNQIPIQAIEIQKRPGNLALKYSLKCPVCGSDIYQVLNVSHDEADFTNFINVFKVIPTLKDELCIIKLDSVNAKLQDDVLTMYGNYTYLRFWDNMVQRDRINISYKIEG